MTRALAISDSHNCVDCGFNTHPSALGRIEAEVEIKAKGATAITFDRQTEVYMLRHKVWADAGMEPWGGCLCIGCVETRLKRRLRPKDFLMHHPFNRVPGTPRLINRRGKAKAYAREAAQ